MSSPITYNLPEERIAQRPIGCGFARAQSKLLHAQLDNFGNLKIYDRVFSDLENLLCPNDLLVLNDSRVLPSRFFIERSGSGGKVEILLVREIDKNSSAAGVVWEALARPMRKLKSGEVLLLSEHLQAEVKGRTEDNQRLILEISTKGTKRSFSEVLFEEGGMPIPPYIRAGHSDNLDRDSYQTVYAQKPGSVAAPTAGLHFTRDLLDRLQAKGIKSAFITLHVGPASFLPVKAQEVTEHPMLVENYEIPESAQSAVRETREKGGRIVAVGTTTVRALESVVLEDPSFFKKSKQESCIRKTRLLIHPGFNFQIVDAMITNFHQSASTHLLLVAAFIGEAATRTIYQHALAHEYRFLSYGDAMFLEPQPIKLRVCE